MNKIYHLSQMQQWREGKKQLRVRVQNDCVIINDIGFYIYKRSLNVTVPSLEDDVENNEAFTWTMKVLKKYKKLIFVTKTGDKRLKGYLFFTYE